MPITPENLPRHELIGLDVEVVESTDETLEDVSGEVMDETRNTLRIDDKTVQKSNCVFLFEIPSGEKVKLDGELIDRAPAERVDMKLPGKWD